MIDFLTNNQLYIVLIIAMISFLGLIFYIFSIDKKIANIDKKIQSMSNNIEQKV